MKELTVWFLSPLLELRQLVVSGSLSDNAAVSESRFYFFFIEIEDLGFNDNFPVAMVIEYVSLSK